MATLQKNDFTRVSPYIFVNPARNAIDIFGNPRQCKKLLEIIKNNAHHAENVKGDMVYYLRVDSTQMNRPKNDTLVLVAYPNIGKELGYYIKFME